MQDSLSCLTRGLAIIGLSVTISIASHTQILIRDTVRLSPAGSRSVQSLPSSTIFTATFVYRSDAAGATFRVDGPCEDSAVSANGGEGCIGSYPGCNPASVQLVVLAYNPGSYTFSTNFHPCTGPHYCSEYTEKIYVDDNHGHHWESPGSFNASVTVTVPQLLDHLELLTACDTVEVGTATTLDVNGRNAADEEVALDSGQVINLAVLEGTGVFVNSSGEEIDPTNIPVALVWMGEVLYKPTDVSASMSSKTTPGALPGSTTMNCGEATLQVSADFCGIGMMQTSKSFSICDKEVPLCNSEPSIVFTVGEPEDDFEPCSLPPPRGAYPCLAVTGLMSEKYEWEGFPDIKTEFCNNGTCYTVHVTSATGTLVSGICRHTIEYDYHRTILSGLSGIDNCETAKEVWNELNKVYQDMLKLNDYSSNAPYIYEPYLLAHEREHIEGTDREGKSYYERVFRQSLNEVKPDPEDCTTTGMIRCEEYEDILEERTERFEKKLKNDFELRWASYSNTKEEEHRALAQTSQTLKRFIDEIYDTYERAWKERPDDCD
jgi:hypothetical protein